MLSDLYSYEGTPRVVYEGGAQFVPVCEGCGRYVKADAAHIARLWDVWRRSKRMRVA